MTPRHLIALAAFSIFLPVASVRAGDAVRGEAAFQQCSSCHSVVAGDTKLQGPNLRGVIGRKAGTLPGFDYSPATIAAGRDRGLVWDEATLDTYLTNPEAMIPGTMMGPVQLDDPAERRDVIAYLKKAAE